MKIIMRIIFIILCFTKVCFSQDSKQKKIIIQNANELIGDNINKLQKLIGDVVILNDNLKINCDSAHIKNNKKEILAYGNVVVNQADTLIIKSDNMKYDSQKKILTADENVEIKEKNRVLKTNNIIFKREKQEIYYNNYGTLIDSTNTLTSQEGLYILKEKKLIFTKDVELKNNKYNLKSNKIIYYKENKIAHSYGNTRIKSNNNKIFCNNAFYYPKKNISILKGDASIFYKNKILKGDSIIYNSKNKKVIAIKNVKLIDTINKLTVISQYGKYFEKKDSCIITQNPIAIRTMGKQKDSLIIKSDTMIFYKDKSPKINSFRNVKIFKSNLKGMCDILTYNFSKSKIKMRDKPTLWFTKYQLKSDSIDIIVDTIKKNIDSLSMLNRASIISRVDSNKFDQTKGRNIFGKFKGENLKILYVKGNAESIHFIKNSKKSVIAMNKIICNDINIHFQKKSITKINFINRPKATTFPIAKLKEKDSKIKGFKWLQKQIPMREDFQITH